MTHRNRRVSGIFGCALAGALVASTLAVAPSAAARPLRPSAGGALPQVTQIPPGAGSHGFPYDAVPTTPAFPGAPTIDLASYGYVERELMMSGTTSTYRQSGFWGSNGRWGVSTAQSTVPYTTRLLVRYPTNPAKFNGTVIVEWLNDTTGGDQDPVWSEIYNQVLSQGDAYVGVTAQTAGMNELKTWDSGRYGALGDSNDGQSYDIFSQAAQVVRADSATLLGGLSPRTVIGTGDSQSAFRLDTYVNAIQPLSQRSTASSRSAGRSSPPPSAAAWSGSGRPRRTSGPTTRRRSSSSTPRATSRSWERHWSGSPTTTTSGRGSSRGPPISTCMRGCTRAPPSSTRFRS